MNHYFARFATAASDVLGHAYVFIVALLLVVLWAVSGPFFQFSDTWQLIINTATTITTGLMVFIIQNTQNRDARAIHIKLDELLRAVQGARGELADVEDRSEEELKDLKAELVREGNGGGSLAVEADHGAHEIKREPVSSMPSPPGDDVRSRRR